MQFWKDCIFINIISIIFSFTLGSDIVGTSIQCGTESCPTSNISLQQSNVTITFEHSQTIEVTRIRYESLNYYIFLCAGNVNRIVWDRMCFHKCSKYKVSYNFSKSYQLISKLWLRKDNQGGRSLLFEKHWNIIKWKSNESLIIVDIFTRLYIHFAYVIATKHIIRKIILFVGDYRIIDIMWCIK